jgi:hypothetical protein
MRDELQARATATKATVTARQIRVRLTTAAAIMATPEFQLGLEHARAGTAFDWGIGGSDINRAWNFERGRLFAGIAPLDMPLRIRGKLNPKAVRLCEAAIERRLII